MLVEDGRNVMGERWFGGCEPEALGKWQETEDIFVPTKIVPKTELDNARRFGSLDLAEEGTGGVQIRRIEARMVKALKNSARNAG